MPMCCPCKCTNSSPTGVEQRASSVSRDKPPTTNSLDQHTSLTPPDMPATNNTVRMSDVVFIELSEEGDNSPVSYKEDGGRFLETQTIKLSVDTKYIVRLTCKEELKSSDMLLNGQAIYMETKSPAPDADPSLKVYEGRFNTDKIPKTKKDKRDVVALQIPLQYSLLVALQCKYYTIKKKKSAAWGETLKNIVVNYKVEEGIKGTKAVVSSIRCRKVM